MIHLNSFWHASLIQSDYNVDLSIQYPKVKDPTFFQGKDIACLFVHDTFNYFWYTLVI